MLNSAPDPSPGPRAPAREPIAIIGIACLYPGARGAEEYWRLLCDAPPQARGAGRGGAGGLDDIDVDVARFGIPPVQRRSMTRMQVLMLEAARQCLTDAGYAGRPLATDRTDVVAGTCFGLDRQYANALRLEAVRYAREVEREMAAVHDARVRDKAGQAGEEFRALMTGRLGASPHDRVGEMASTIPARIAGTFGLRGRTLTVESADATSFVALWHALNNLQENLSDAVLVLTGQRRESPLLSDLLAAKSLPGALGEGVSALLLKRRSSAVRDGDRIYASILGCTLGHDARPGTLRYSTSPERRRQVALACHRQAGAAPESVQFVEHAGMDTKATAQAERDGFAGLFRNTVIHGRAGDCLGYTLANAGLASVAKAALALYHRKLPPQRQWPQRAEGAPCRAAVCGASLTGTLCHLVLEEHDSRRPGRPATHANGSGRVTTRPEPIAIVGMGGRFAGSPNLARFWNTVRSGQDHIRPLPDSLLDRELYYATQGMTLTHSYTELGAWATVPEAPPPGLRITPLRYEAMDAAQRVALAVADEALTRYGRLDMLAGRPGVVAIGSNLSLSKDRRLNAERGIGELESAASHLDALADLPKRTRERLLGRARKRYGLPEQGLGSADLDGCLASGVAALIANEYRLAAVPVAVEAACASSLAAVDLAVGALRSGEADYALTGGVELACNARDLVLCSALGLLSHTRITPFDAAADGFSPGDGCALFLMKRLPDARRDGDRIFALVRGVGASNDARSLIAPDVDGQVRAMQQAFDQVEFDPASVDYLEAHGTGTRVGDQVEIAATAQVYAKPDRQRPLVIGSAKSVFGHTFAAAGGAGLLKALLSIHARTFPPNANLETPGVGLPLDDIPAVLPTTSMPWSGERGRPRRAGVSSFGTGGINYHLLIEEPEKGAR
jgi:acyl transferase domain-containing protein